MMFADYYLTLASVISKDKGYANHFKVEHWELNPIWQKQVAQKKWFNPKHILIVALFSSVAILLPEYGTMPDSFCQAFLGCLIGMFSIIVGRHLSNLLIFRYVTRNPDEISGQITMSHDFVLSMSLYQYLGICFFLGLIALLSRSLFVIGSFVGAVLVVTHHSRWIRRHRKQLKASKQSPEKVDKVAN